MQFLRLSCQQFNKKSLISPFIIHRLITTNSISPEQQVAHNEQLTRPLSPHLTIWRPQLTMIMSGLHRITGVAVAGVFYLWGMENAIFSIPTATLVESIHSIPAVIAFPMKFLISGTFAYHCFNGVRHLIWDTGKFLSLKGVYSTGWVVVGLTLLGATALTVCYQ